MSRRFSMITFLIAILGVVLALIAMVSARTLRPENGTLGSQTQGETAAEATQSETAAEATQGEDIQYVMYVGTNDSETNEPVCSPEEAKVKAQDILIEHFGGYTIQEARGGWVDGDDVYQEYTLVIYISDTDLEQVHKAADDLVKEFHQSAVLIQANKTTTEFYMGK